jgi:hypothetical protein
VQRIVFDGGSNEDVYMVISWYIRKYSTPLAENSPVQAMTASPSDPEPHSSHKAMRGCVWLWLDEEIGLYKKENRRRQEMKKPKD